MRRKNDRLLKSAFEEAFPDFLRFFFTQADTLFDIDRGSSSWIKSWEQTPNTTTKAFWYLEKELKLMIQRFTDAEIASFAAVTDEFVRKIGREFNQ